MVVPFLLGPELDMGKVRVQEGREAESRRACGAQAWWNSFRELQVIGMWSFCIVYKCGSKHLVGLDKFLE